MGETDTTNQDNVESAVIQLESTILLLHTDIEAVKSVGGHRERAFGICSFPLARPQTDEL